MEKEWECSWSARASVRPIKLALLGCGCGGAGGGGGGCDLLIMAKTQHLQRRQKHKQK
jgi:hypothetical protein